MTITSDRETRLTEAREYIAAARAHLAEVQAKYGQTSGRIHQDGAANTALMAAEHMTAKIAAYTAEFPELA